MLGSVITVALVCQRWKNGMHLAENLFLGECDEELAYELFMESPTHRANIEHGYQFERSYKYDIPNSNRCLIAYIYAENN